jgi:hypothetical protein
LGQFAEVPPPELADARLELVEALPGFGELHFEEL